MRGIHYSLFNKSLGNEKVEKYNSFIYIFSYPCESRFDCTPYEVNLTKGTYKIECYGGGLHAGGAYTSGILVVEKELSVFFYLGAQGYSTSQFQITSIKPTYNGGGGGNLVASYTGNGATDVRLIGNEEWSNFDSLKSRIMVAAGSGGADYGSGGVGGALIGGNGGKGSCDETGYCAYPYFGYGANNTHGGNGTLNGTFGYAGSSLIELNRNGGGGGYYGGGSSIDIGAGAGGGSSFISGYYGCDAIYENSTYGNVYHTGQSIHYSKITFNNPIMQDGNKSFIAPNRKNNETGHHSTGNVVVTILFQQNNTCFKTFARFNHFLCMMLVIMVK